MILILSRHGDVSTDWVIDWLIHYDCTFIRINASDIYQYPFKIDLNNKIIYLNGQEIPLEDINVVWYRKFRLNKFNLYDKKHFDFKTVSHLDREYNVMVNSMLYLLKDKHWLTHYTKATLNKPEVLLKAIEAGLDTPSSYLINNRIDLEELISCNNIQYITKSVWDGTSMVRKDQTYTMYTKLLNTLIIKEGDLPSIFHPSFIQNNIEKEYELRVFYINKKIYSMAIFSQSDKQTGMDFRDYNWEKPNRCVPYKLPIDLKKKIIKLMVSIGLNCGSLDFIKSKDGEYYFLEVNPVGQFGMIDIPCNYHLHQKVALELIKMNQL